MYETLRFSQPEKNPVKLDLATLIGVVQAVRSHNRQSSPGKILGEFVSSRLDDDNSFSLDIMAVNRRAFGEVVKTIYENPLKAIGVVIEPEAKDTTMISININENRWENTSARFVIQDPEKFALYLKELKEKVKDIPEKVKSAIGTIGYDLFLQIYQHHTGFREDKNVPEIEKHLSEIVRGFKKLKIKAQDDEMRNPIDRLKDLETYSKYAKEGILPEYIDCEDLLQKPGKGFGPGDWQGDSTPDYLRRLWEDTMLTLIKIEQNPRAKKLHKQLRSHLLRCIKYAKKFIIFNLPPGDEYDKKMKILKTYDSILRKY